jgi:glucose/arabinose dehydrogenase
VNVVDGAMKISRSVISSASRCLGTAALLGAYLVSPGSANAQTTIQVPSGFHATVFAGGLSGPTALAQGPDGRLYVAEEGGQIIAVGSGGNTIIASGFTTPLGLAWNKHVLYVSSTGQVSTLTPTNGYRSFKRRVINSGLPTGRHQNDGMAFRNGWMYLGVGSTCNACVETDPRSATIMRFHYDGTHAQIYAHGLRNPYGLAFRPGTSQLYATDNGRDDFGNSVPDELNAIVRGGKYGWPDCWGNGGGSNCAGTIAPVADMEPHASADGLVFYTGKTFSNAYRGDAFIAEYGDTITTLDTGHRVKRIHFSGKKATVSDFAIGLDHPLALAVGPGGALLVADFGTGIVWRIQANGH